MLAGRSRGVVVVFVHTPWRSGCPQGVRGTAVAFFAAGSDCDCANACPPSNSAPSIAPPAMTRFMCPSQWKTPISGFLIIAPGRFAAASKPRHEAARPVAVRRDFFTEVFEAGRRAGDQQVIRDD